MEEYRIIKNFKKFIEFMNEGMIKTYPLKTTIKLLTRKLGELKITSAVDFEESTDTIFVKTVSGDLTDDKLSEIFNVVSLCGYFPSTIDYYNSDDMIINSIKYNENFKLIKNNDVEFIQIIIESKFNKIIKNPKKLYHITKLNNIKRIEKYGLVPKSENKKAYHKERIYFGINVADVINLIYQFDDKTEYILLEIDTTNLDIILYDDPDFTKNGCYTHDNIPYSNNKIIRKIKNY